MILKKGPNRRQLTIVVFCLVCNLSLSLPTIKYLKVQLWGMGFFSIPDLTLHFGQHAIKTYTIVNMHVLISAVLLILMPYSYSLNMHDSFIHTHTKLLGIALH